MKSKLKPINLEVQANEIVEIYLNSIDVKKTTKSTYSRALKRFISWLRENEIVQPNRNDLLEYKNFLMKSYKASTVSSYITAVKGLYVYLESEKISPNIANGIKGAKHQQGFKKDPLTVEQTKELLSSIDRTTITGKRDFAILNLLVRTGLRTIEIERANIEDIRQQGGVSVLYVQGKGQDDKDDFVVLTESTLNPLREYIQARLNPDSRDPLFLSHSNRSPKGRLTTRSISRIAKSSLKAIGIDDDRITAHSLRHTAITLSLIGGATIQEAQRMARHRNINTTLIYAHNINRVDHAPEKKIDSLLIG